MSLSKQEQELVYNIEVLGMKPARAAELAGVPDIVAASRKPEVVAARHILRESVRQYANVTRADIVVGIRDAIDQARVIADPMAQIRGWVEIASLTGLDRPKRVELSVANSVETQRRQIAQLPDSELMQIEGGDVIDADFYVVRDAQ